MEPVDDPLLTAFLAGSVTPEQRAHVLRHLLDDPDARDLVGMSTHALNAAAGGLSTAAPRRRRTHALVRVSLAALTLLTGGVALRLATTASEPATDTLRSSAVDAPLTVRVDGATVSWNALPGASRYDVVVWDATTASVTARTSTADTSSGDAFNAALADASASAQQVRVDAFDAENRLIASSSLTALGR